MKPRTPDSGQKFEDVEDQAAFAQFKGEVLVFAEFLSEKNPASLEKEMQKYEKSQLVKTLADEALLLMSGKGYSVLEKPLRELIEKYPRLKKEIALIARLNFKIILGT